MKTIEIDGKKYEINLEKAARDGYLKEIPDFPLNSGDVYVSSKGYLPTILIKPFYEQEEFVMLGYFGLNPFSSNELQKILSKQEVIDIFTIEGYKFSHNINKKVRELIENPA